LGYDIYYFKPTLNFAILFFCVQIKEQMLKNRVGLSVILFVLLVGYGLGIITAVAGWSGTQYIDESMWIFESLPYYGLVFGLGFVSALAVARHKRWGVYGLVLAWVLTIGLNLLYVTPLPNAGYKLVGVLLVLAFFMLLRPVWPEMT
jgi:hypothetical protein